MTGSPQRAADRRCYYWVCASILMDAEDCEDPRAIQRVYEALACARAAQCVRVADCRDLALSALARLLQRRPRE